MTLSGFIARTMVFPPSTEIVTLQGRRTPASGAAEEGLVGRRRMAGPEDQVRGDVDVQLLLERRRDVDLRDDAEALAGEELPGARDGVLEGAGRDGFVRDRGRWRRSSGLHRRHALFRAASGCLLPLLSRPSAASPAPGRVRHGSRRDAEARKDDRLEQPPAGEEEGEAEEISRHRPDCRSLAAKSQ